MHVGKTSILNKVLGVFSTNFNEIGHGRSAGVREKPCEVDVLKFVTLSISDCLQNKTFLSEFVCLAVSTDQ